MPTFKFDFDVKSSHIQTGIQNGAESLSESIKQASMNAERGIKEGSANIRDGMQEGSSRIRWGLTTIGAGLGLIGVGIVIAAIAYARAIRPLSIAKNAIGAESGRAYSQAAPNRSYDRSAQAQAIGPNASQHTHQDYHEMTNKKNHIDNDMNDKKSAYSGRI